MSIACPPNPKILRLSFIVAPPRRVGKRRRSTFCARWRTCRRLHRATDLTMIAALTRAREAHADSSELCARAAPSRPTGSTRVCTVAD
jgi:hypothetical protein